MSLVWFVEVTGKYSLVLVAGPMNHDLDPDHESSMLRQKHQEILAHNQIQLAKMAIKNKT